MNKCSVLVIAEGQSHGLYGAFSLEGERIAMCSSGDVFDCIGMQPDIVLLDCGPDLRGGLILLKELRDLHPEMPVILVSEDDSDDAAVKAFGAGAREFFARPFNIVALEDALECILKIRRSSQKRQPFVSVKSRAVPIGNNLRRVVRYIEEHLSDDIRLDTLAQEARLSKYHFCRSFNRHMVTSPMKFVTAMRVERAKELLRSGEITVARVAEEVGFGDPGNFIRQFKKLTGVTPTGYKSLLR